MVTSDTRTILLYQISQLLIKNLTQKDCYYTSEIISTILNFNSYAYYLLKDKYPGDNISHLGLLAHIYTLVLDKYNVSWNEKDIISTFGVGYMDMKEFRGIVTG
jgi:hypothetical protein